LAVAALYWTAVPAAVIAAAIVAAFGLSAVWVLHAVTFAVRTVALTAQAGTPAVAAAGASPVAVVATRRHALRIFTSGLGTAAMLSLMMPRGAVAQSPCDRCPGYRYTCITTQCTTTGIYCCPDGHPYLNHCDCLCYDSTGFNCSSYSNCNYCG